MEFIIVVPVERKIQDFVADYIAKSPVNTTGVSRVLLPEAPSSVLVNGKEVYDASAWDAESHTYFLSYENSPEGVSVEFEW